MEKKSNKGLIALIILLTILVLGLGTYVAYDKFLRPSETKSETKKDSELKTKMTRKTRIMLLALAVICAASIGLNIVQALSNSNKDNAHVNQKTVPVQVTDSIKNNKQM